MFLSRIELQGFKSFADKTVLEFRPGITTIVGPNGSGKSNISDAIRWVFGEQSTKSLRGKESTDMIFTGSRKRPRLGLASVSLVLDNSDGSAPLDYPEIVLTRRLSRGGESEYFMNKTTVRLLDIAMFLAKSHIGAKSYTVVSQGAIDSLINALPHERKNYFDEAVGVKEFQIKRDQSVHKLLRTEEHLADAKRLMDALEPRLRTLTRQVRRLEKRERFEVELRASQTRYYGGLWRQIQAGIQGVEQAERKRNVDLQRRERAMTQLQEQSDELAEAPERQQQFQQLQREQQQLEQTYHQRMRELVIQRGQLELHHQQQGGSEEAWLVHRQQELSDALTPLKTEFASLPIQRERIRERVEHLEQQQQSLQQQLKDAEYQLLKQEHTAHHQDATIWEHLRKEFTQLRATLEQFVRDLLSTRDLKAFRELQQRGEYLLERFEALASKIPAASPQQPATKSESSNRFRTLSNEQRAVLQQISDLRVEESRISDRQDYLVSTIADYERELRELRLKLQRMQPRASGNRAQQTRRIQTELDRLEKERRALEERLKKQRQLLQAFQEEQQQANRKLLDLQHQLRTLQTEWNQQNAAAQQLREERVRLETRREDLEQEIRHEPVAVDLKKIQTWKHTVEPEERTQLDQKIQQLKKQLELIGGMEPETIEEYQQSKERFEFLSRERNDLEQAMGHLHQMIDELDHTIRSRFQEAFRDINQHFQHYVRILFGGGSARLELQHEIENPATVLDPETGLAMPSDEEGSTTLKPRKVISGIEIDVQPPGKKLKNLSALSGGEKALTSIALLCAILHQNPSPFVVLDEVEAALDEANSERFAEILSKLSERSQLILITHNRATMNRADVLYGVTMGTDGVSRMLSVKFEELTDQMIGKPTPKS
ncbi:MAG: AAA family ATPase [Candidatus Kerfeldbacteria bacterium]|nr:AAA family ATPase [Candidatus Kerfeldbacteria bacterium]